MSSTETAVALADGPAMVRLLTGASPAAVDVFARILTRGPIARIDLSRDTGFSQAAVTKVVAPLVAAGLVTDAPLTTRSPQPGRPASPLRAVPEALCFLGIKVNIDELIGVATDLEANVLASVHTPLPGHSPDEVVDAVVALVGRLRSQLGRLDDRLAGIGVSVSGDVDSEHGVVRESGLLGWLDMPLGARLQQRLGRTVMVEGDVPALTVGQYWFGRGVDTDSFAIVTIGKGIGCGLLVGGEVVEGAYGVAGEIGHFPLASDTEICHCGRRGCVEAVASSDAIVAVVERAGIPVPGGIDGVAELARSGDPVALEAFARAGTVIGKAIATVVNLTGPELILIAGEGVANFDLFEPTLRAAFAEHAFGAAGRCRLEVRPHTFDDWARGAATTVIRALVTQRTPYRA